MPLSMQELREIYARLTSDKTAQEFYGCYPRNTWWERENHACSTGLIESARSAEELVQEMQRTYLFSINSEGENRRLAVDWMVEQYRKAGLDILALPKEIEESAVSYEPNCV